MARESSGHGVGDLIDEAGKRVNISSIELKEKRHTSWSAARREALRRGVQDPKEIPLDKWDDLVSYMVKYLRERARRRLSASEIEKLDLDSWRRWIDGRSEYVHITEELAGDIDPSLVGRDVIRTSGLDAYEARCKTSAAFDWITKERHVPMKQELNRAGRMEDTAEPMAFGLEEWKADVTRCYLLDVKASVEVADAESMSFSDMSEEEEEKLIGQRIDEEAKPYVRRLAQLEEKVRDLTNYFHE